MSTKDADEHVRAYIITLAKGKPMPEVVTNVIDRVLIQSTLGERRVEEVAPVYTINALASNSNVEIMLLRGGIHLLGKRINDGWRVVLARQW